MSKKLSIVEDTIQKYGNCESLISIDPNFHELSISLFVKDNIATVWSFSHKKGIDQRIEQIRDQLIHLGGMTPIPGTHNQAQFPNGEMYKRPLKFLIRQAVEKPADFRHPAGPIRIKDLRSPLTIEIIPQEASGGCVYEVTTIGEHKTAEIRKRAIVQGLVRYGDMEKVEPTKAIFPNGYRRDELVRIVLPYARNITGTQDMLEADSMRGQMTTGTLGFSPPV